MTIDAEKPCLRRRRGRRNPTQRQDALDRAVSNAAGRLLQVMQELDLDPSFASALTRPRADDHADRAHATLHLRIGALDAITARYGFDVGGVLLTHLARLLQPRLRDGDPIGRPANDALSPMMIQAPAETARDRLRILHDSAGRHGSRQGDAVIPFRLLASVVPVPPEITVTAVLENFVACTRANNDEDPKP